MILQLHAEELIKPWLNKHYFLLSMEPLGSKKDAFKLPKVIAANPILFYTGLIVIVMLIVGVFFVCKFLMGRELGFMLPFTNHTGQVP